MCASFVTAPPLSYRACDERRLVSSCPCSAPSESPLGPIGALVLGCPPLGNLQSHCTRSYNDHGSCIPEGSGQNLFFFFTQDYNLC